MATSEETAAGYVIGVYFHSVHVHCRTIVWQVNFLPLDPNDGETECYFVVDTLTKEAMERMPEIQECVPSITEHARDLAIWELALRLQNQTIVKAVRTASLPVVLIMTVGRIVNDVIPCPNFRTPRPLACAYLHCEATVTFEVPLTGPAASTGTWHSSIYRECAISAIEICLKTSRGIYSCQSNEAPEAKREKRGLDISDVFVCLTYDIPIAGRVLSLLVPHAPAFHVLWINEDSKWNGAAVEFFRALHHKLFSERNGIPPLWLYVFPGAVEEGTAFAPLLPAFPCIPLRYGSPTSLDRASVQWDLFEPHILTHFDGIKRTSLADTVFGYDSLAISRECEDQYVWPTPVTDININLCTDSDTMAIVREPSGLVAVNLEALLRTDSVLSRVSSIVSLDTLLDLSTPECRRSVELRYNSLLSTVLSWSTSRGHKWAAIVKWKLFFLVQALEPEQWSPEFKDLKRACQMAGFTLKGGTSGDLVFSSHANLLFSTSMGYFLHAGSPRSTAGTGGEPNPRHITGPDTEGNGEHRNSPNLCGFVTWLQSLTTCIERALNMPPDTSWLQLIEEVIPLYFHRRRQTSFWLIPLSHCEGIPVCPPLPFDCLAPRLFIVTKSGPMCYRAGFSLPVDVNYLFYLEQTLKAVRQVSPQEHNPQDAKEMTLQLEAWTRLLSLF
ncbi:MAG: ORF40 [Human gammaherpesvirus 8]|uniref:ORF40 n=1 Tax=Human herpesvirus 8 TaxID=37296 RepID=A0A0N9SG75_HHV8|nr:ORF40 [Human gammaherpesvirus 8]ALH44896.1 ORF40 [Human gammaherpesvirus 8]ALH45072.1 ORF40 [Human gammaherpesvirus 8]ALH45246.1 ORF40 [Human gammaherpesvirus 8]ALH45334.1 ORF40 [Human gammaherpesvirus 8]